MKTIALSLFTFLFFVSALAQIGFEEHIMAGGPSVTNETRGFTTADFDGDGDLDIIASGSRNHNTVSWFDNTDGQGNYGPEQIIITTPDYVSTIFATDLDGDDYLDVVVLCNSGILWYKNIDGLGAFGDQQIINPDRSGFYANDFDKDGDIDILCTDWVSQGQYGYENLVWYENTDGQGNFSIRQTFGAFYYDIDRFFVTDVDNDGFKDVIVISSSGVYGDLYAAGWCKYLVGSGTFSTPRTISSGIYFMNAWRILDMDADGDVDVFGYSNMENIPSWWENIDGTGNFLKSTTNLPYCSLFYDINGDENDDCIGGGNIHWFENIDGNGQFQIPPEVLVPGVDASIILMSDCNGDGHLDIIFGGDNGMGWIEKIDGLGTFGIPQSIGGAVANAVKLGVTADIDGDGDEDVLSASMLDDKIAWYENINGLGEFGVQQVISNNADGAWAVLVDDINGDGALDVISASRDDNKIAWYENIDGVGNFSEQQIIANTEIPYAIYTADIDGDGDIDVLSARGYDNSIVWYENEDGLGNFGSEQSVFNVQFPICVYAVDIDNDGDMDVLSGTTGTGNLYWFENEDGMGNFQTRHNIAYINNLRAVHAADIDQDGDMDVLSAEGAGNKISWHENTDGLGNFGSKQVISNNIEYGYSIYSADIDRDGDMDVVSASNYDNKLAWYENTNGLGHFGEQQIISTNSSGLNSIFISDVNGDDRQDVLSTSYNDNKIAWYENLGFLGNNINGTVLLDVSGDACNPSDPPMPNLLVVSDNGTNSFASFTQLSGHYSNNTNEGNFTTSIETILPEFYTINPNAETSNFEGLDNIDTIDFCVEPTESVNDVNITLLPTNEPRPGFSVSYRLVYRNVGSTQLSGNLVLEFDNTKLFLFSASPAPSGQTGNSLSFDYTGLNPFETRSIELNFKIYTPPTVQIGDFLNFVATINPIIGDYTEEDNVFTMNQIVIGSYDPNDISVLEGDKIYINDIDKYLHYIIRFQNTGTADAINVKVTNVLDPNLDWRTLQLENISHPNRIEIKESKNVSFIFTNIILPDSTSNEPKSHGYIAYKIKPKETVSVGDLISNDANIFFDFNPAIVTNTVTTKIIDDLNDVTSGFVIFPNPTTGIVSIQSEANIVQIDVTNSLGQLVLTNTHKSSIDMVTLARGLYILKITDVNGNLGIKKVLKD